MNHYLYLIFIIIASYLLVNLINYEFNLTNDNPIEQAIELIVQEETGLKIDFTP